MSLTALVQNNAAAIKRMEQTAPILCEWFDRELMDLHRSMPQSSGGLLMGCPARGDAYIDAWGSTACPRSAVTGTSGR